MQNASPTPHGLNIHGSLLPRARRAIACAAALIPALLVPLSAHAEVNRYSGLSCVQEQDSTPDIRYLANAVLENKAAVARKVLCDLPVATSFGPMALQWTVTLNRNGNTSANWDVVLTNSTANGSIGFTSLLTVSGQDGWRTLTGTPLNLPFSNTFISTTVPADSLIGGFTLTSLSGF